VSAAIERLLEERAWSAETVDRPTLTGAGERGPQA
jgi:hypothetical protein